MRLKIAAERGATWHGPPGGVGGASREDALAAEPVAGTEQEDHGSAVVLTTVFRRHHLELVRMALFIVGDQATAEDVVQDAFAAVHRRIDRLRDPGNPLPYIRASVLNGCRGVLRRRAVARRFGGDYEPPIWSAESAALLGEDRREVFLALRSLPRRQREALVLRYYLDLSEAEIAEVMGVSRGTVKSTTSRALTALARKLGEES
ncbi:RNA polymerase sigma factor [Actinoallomurus rhizosphaericola]|uniref:RNA polymerase sigma factor n=1 Tax=Actinoallomurus rhizosphaericola TaxID=2952536 RepID=UPI0020937B87|nr:SigE family RNA polymerase sigma factor [Actinoallomurus rhizosphaericola]MCO5996840.1 SigE family RNA polymerase sigma factor [Actinoallomurus rhizosphaericola]